ncbi:MAG: hypothetical protein WAQ32_04590 [Dethiobacteria bacterium]|nr:hypothetical protein [Bacillota bacterium]NMD33277.1 hypothetical protein [Bacillota bacterium]HOB29500.1 hypothetical protein [Bacillota bacterium]HPZ42208.1 hypothetical protein [Bacillota bacterium]HQD53049.1 hypothetical protein [Bacillota bacterium]
MSLKRLWKLQELDLAIGVLEDKIENNPLRQEAGTAEECLARAEEALNRAEQSLKEQRKKLKRGELDLEAITTEYKELHQRLYSGEVKNIKELEQMEIRLRSVKQNQLTLEEKLLGLMEAIEEQEELAHGLTGQRDKAAAERQERQRQLDEELARLRNELDQLQEQRELLAARIEPKQMQLYRDLARRHQGRGLARVINDICQGCSVFISSAQRGFLYDPEALVYCENCGRLLVRFTEEETRTDWVE